MFCKNCGNQAVGLKRFCTKCGTEFPKTSSENVLTALPKAPKEPWTKKRIFKVLALVVLIGGALFLKFGILAINSLNESAVDTNNGGINALNSGDSQQAISQFQQASNSAFTDDAKMNSLKNLAYTYSSEGDDKMALSKFKEALTLTSNGSFENYLISGEIALIEKDFDGAHTAYNNAYDLEPENFQINNALALFYLDITEDDMKYRDYKKALTFAQKTYQLDNSLELTKQNLAIAYFYNENYQQSISLLSSSNFTQHPYSAYWLGLAYAASGDVINARVYLQQAISSGVEVDAELKEKLNLN